MGFTMVTRVGPATRDKRVIAALAQVFLRAVAMSNMVTMREAKRRGKPFPSLYDSGVVYRREPLKRGQQYEEFADILTIYRRGWGDCDDLCAWRVAELRFTGEDPKADIRLYWRPKSNVMHVEVRRGDGSIEDPSRFLGL